MCVCVLTYFCSCNPRVVERRDEFLQDILTPILSAFSYHERIEICKKYLAIKQLISPLCELQVIATTSKHTQLFKSFSFAGLIIFVYLLKTFLQF
jgi:hypothetical protein